MQYMARSVIIGLLCSLVFCGCGGGQAGQSNNKKVVFWHVMIDRDQALQELAEKYEVKTGIHVEFKLFFPPDIYSQKVIAAARAGNLPDIFAILGEKKTLASFIKAGHILNLKPYLSADNDQWKNTFYPQTIALTVFGKNNTYGAPAGMYGIPIDTAIMQFVYNKDLLENAGLDPNMLPQTFDAFIYQAKRVREKLGKEGFVCGWAEGWLMSCLATEWAINLMGQEKFIDTIKGEVPYTDKDWIKVFDSFAQLRDSGILAQNITTMINKEAEDMFSKGQAAFSFNGSWAINVYKQLNPELNYGFFSLPAISDKHPVRVWGGAGSSFMVNAHSAKKEQAVAFLKWLTDLPQQEFLVKETNNLPSVQGLEDKLPPVLKGLVDDLSVLTHPDVWEYNEDSRVIEVRDKGLQQIVMGLKTPEQVAQEIQEVKERISKK